MLSPYRLVKDVHHSNRMFAVFGPEMNHPVEIRFLTFPTTFLPCHSFLLAKHPDVLL